MSETREQLMAELARREDVCLDQVLEVGRNSNGQLIWLEMGNAKSGWQHILAKITDFESRGIPSDQVPQFLMAALQQGCVCGLVGRTMAICVNYGWA